MPDNNVSWIANFIWGIADDVLRDVNVRGKYRDVILPMTVIRRLDALLEPTKEAVLNMKALLDVAGSVDQTAALCQAAGEGFCNASKFTLRNLKARAKQQQLKADFEDISTVSPPMFKRSSISSSFATRSLPSSRPTSSGA